MPIWKRMIAASSQSLTHSRLSWSASQDSPQISDRTKNVYEEELILQHLGEPPHQRNEPLVTHGWQQIVEQAALTEQRVNAAFVVLDLSIRS